MFDYSFLIQTSDKFSSLHAFVLVDMKMASVGSDVPKVVAFAIAMRLLKFLSLYVSNIQNCPP